MRRNYFWILLTFLFLPAGFEGQASAVKVANLKDLMEQSHRIFLGRCIAAEEKSVGNIPITEYTFEVVQSVKGAQSRLATIRQFGSNQSVALPGGLKRSAVLPGMPSYQEGEEYLLFLVEESPIGLSSPVGLFQGAFLARDGFLVNGANNRNLTYRLDASWLRERGLNAGDTEQVVKAKQGPLRSEFLLEILQKLSGTPE